MLRLPESVIPVDSYEDFQAPLKVEDYDHTTAIREYQRLFTLLPPVSRQLLLYLLDLLAVFASKYEINKMTSARLAAIFQPAILSPVKAGEDFIEEAEACRLSQDVLHFLIENQDDFLIEMSRSNS